MKKNSSSQQVKTGIAQCTQPVQISQVGEELFLYNDANILIYQHSVTSVAAHNSNRPGNFVLNQNYPNPFDPTTTINYSIGKEAHTKITVYNLIGSKVSVIVDENKPAGSYSVQFNAATLPSGIYFYTIQADRKSVV